MSPAALVGQLRCRGVLLAPAGDGRLRYHPREALSDADREYLARNRTAILALFEADPVGWRAAVMAAQVRRTVALPLFLARASGLRSVPAALVATRSIATSGIAAASAWPRPSACSRPSRLLGGPSERPADGRRTGRAGRPFPCAWGWSSRGLTGLRGPPCPGPCRGSADHRGAAHTRADGVPKQSNHRAPA
jgi:hypothetical protein